MSLRIGVDGFNLALSKGTGVATYARTLTHALHHMGYSVDMVYGLELPNSSNTDLREVQFFEALEQPKIKKSKLFSKKWINDRKIDIYSPSVQEIPFTGRVEVRPLNDKLPYFDRIFNSNSIFRKAARYFRRTGKMTTIYINNPPDIMHWTYPIPIKLAGSKNIYTIHDMVPLKLPYTTLDNKGFYFNLISEISKVSDGICTVSKSSLNDIISFFPESREKIYNTYQCLNHLEFNQRRGDAECIAQVEANFGLTPRSYFIFFGSLEPKKNIGRLIEAFLASGSKKKLVLVGAQSWKSEKELRYLDYGIKVNKIILIEYLPESTLFALLRLSRALLFPSLSEGFGLPVLEAMHYGVPTLISNEGALPEVGGEASFKTDAYDVDVIAKAIFALEHDDALCAKLIAAGHVQAAQFDMASYCKRLGELYHSVY